MKSRPYAIERFKGKFNRRGPDECWEWTAGRHGKTDYGKFHDEDGRSVRAHRYSWEVFVGPIPEGMQVLHKCNNKGCVNPDHLYIGDDSDNHRDMADAGVFIQEQPWNRKLFDEDALLIRELLNIEGLTIAALARMFNVSRLTIRNVRDNVGFLTRGPIRRFA